MHTVRLSLFLVASLALTACGALSTNHAVNDSMVSGLSTAERARIDAARTEHDRCGDELSAARQAVVRSEAQCTLAKRQLDLLEARVDKAEAGVAVAMTGTTEELEAAQEQLKTAQSAVDSQHGLIGWRECEVTQSERAMDVAERTHELAGAKVELEKARAFSGSDKALAIQVDVGKSEADVRECEARVAHAKIELDTATKECAVAEETYGAGSQASN